MTIDAADEQGAHYAQGGIVASRSMGALFEKVTGKRPTSVTITDPPPAANEIRVFVPGKPAPQGSKRYLGRHGGKGITVESSKAVAPWRADIREAMLAELEVRGDLQAPIAGAVSVCLNFVMPRPASTPKRRTPPAIKRPDLDKLARAVLDAIGSAGVWVDDSQVISLSAYKRIAMAGETPGVEIRIEQEDGSYVG